MPDELPADLVRLSKEVRQNREIEAQLVVERARRQAQMEQNLSDTRAWIEKLVRELGVLAELHPEDFNPDGLPLNTLVRMIDEEGSVAFGYHGQTFAFKPMGGMLHFSVGGGPASPITDPVEGTLRAMAIAAVRDRLKPRNPLDGNSYTNLLDDD